MDLMKYLRCDQINDGSISIEIIFFFFIDKIERARNIYNIDTSDTKSNSSISEKRKTYITRNKIANIPAMIKILSR